jgi:hypothetical protein
VAVPGRAEAVEVSAPGPGEMVVRLTLDSGDVITTSLRELYDPIPQAVDVVNLYSFLWMQSVAPELLQATMDRFDPAWEEKAATQTVERRDQSWGLPQLPRGPAGPVRSRRRPPRSLPRPG